MLYNGWRSNGVDKKVIQQHLSQIEGNKQTAVCPCELGGNFAVCFADECYYWQNLLKLNYRPDPPIEKNIPIPLLLKSF